MTSQNPEHDIKTLWRGQETQHGALSAEQIRQRVGGYRARIRREGMVAVIACLALTAVSVGIVLSGHPARNVARLITFIAFSDLWWEVLTAYRSRTSVWPWLPKGAMTGDTPAPCVEFYRTTLESHRKHWWMGYLDVYVMGVVILTGLLGFWGQTPAYFYLLGMVCMVVIVAVRKSQARRLNWEIEALDESTER